MKKLLNPVLNAKIWGFLLIVGGMLQLVDCSIFLIRYPNKFSFSSVASIIHAIISITIGIGLRKTKLWGLYSFIIYSIISILFSIRNILYSSLTVMQEKTNIMLSYNTILVVALLTIVFQIIICLWFYSGKKHFT